MSYPTQRPRYRALTFAMVGIVILTTVVTVTLFAFKRLGTGPLAAAYLTLTDLKQLVTSSTKAQPLAASQLVTITVPLLPAGSRNVIVYLPVGYVPKPKARYPTAYILHGTPGKETDWIELGNAQQTLDQLIEAGSIRPFIAVFPDGNGGLDRDTQYINATDGSELNENFIWQQLVGAIDTQFPTQRTATYRAIGGISSGGFGALNIGLKHQTTFGEIFALSGYGQIDQNDQSAQLIQGSSATIMANSPLEYLPNLTQHTSPIWLADGGQDPFVQQNEELETALQAQHFQAELHISPGSHNWDYWSTHLTPALNWLGVLWK